MEKQLNSLLNNILIVSFPIKDYKSDVYSC